MGTFPFGYQPIEATTWAYLSSLLMLALFFKFNRFWSFRNIDLALIVLLAPGLLMVHYGINPPKSIVQNLAVAQSIDHLSIENGSNSKQNSDPSSSDVEQPSRNSEPADKDNPSQPSLPNGIRNGDANNSEDNSTIVEKTSPQHSGQRGYSPLEHWQRSLQYRGFLWLFAIGGVWLVRMLIDPSLKRKPFLESNLSSGGLSFLACSLMIFLFANIITSRPQVEDLSGPKGAVEMIQGEAQDLGRVGPGYALFNLFPTIPTFMNDAQMLREAADKSTKTHKYEIAAKSMAIVSQIAIVLALVFFGRNHFNDLRIGIGMAAIYLMLPYTAQMTGRVMHVLPAALLLWSIALHRRPLVAGALLGLAASVAYYPLFLIPLFVSFYWIQGRTRFIVGLTCAISVAIASLFFTSTDWSSFVAQLQAMFGFWLPKTENLGEGIWSLGWPSAYRLPFLAGFFALCVTFAFWPSVKTLGSLLSCSCAAMIAVQFWHGYGGGLYMGWYIPLALLVVFRPNLDDRVAEQVVPASSRSRRASISESKADSLTAA